MVHDCLVRYLGMGKQDLSGAFFWMEGVFSVFCNGRKVCSEKDAKIVSAQECEEDRLDLIDYFEKSHDFAKRIVRLAWEQNLTVPEFFYALNEAKSICEKLVEQERIDRAELGGDGK